MNDKIEQRARELLAVAERGPIAEYGVVHRRTAHQAITAALREQAAPKPEAQAVGVDYWLAVDDSGGVLWGESTDDANDGAVARQNVNNWINENGPELRIVGARRAALTSGVACGWHQEDEHGDCYGTDCGHNYIVNDNETAGLKFCPFCGKPSEFIAWTRDDIPALTTPASHDAQQAAHAVEAYKTMLAQAEADLRDARAALAQQPAVVGDARDGAVRVTLAEYSTGIATTIAEAAMALPAGTYWLVSDAALTPAATPGDGPVSASDWRDLYRLQTAMRYMDCNANLTRDTAYSMADADIGRIEALAQKEGNGNG